MNSKQNLISIMKASVVVLIPAVLFLVLLRYSYPIWLDRINPEGDLTLNLLAEMLGVILEITLLTVVFGLFSYFEGKRISDENRLFIKEILEDDLDFLFEEIDAFFSSALKLLKDDNAIKDIELSLHRLGALVNLMDAPLSVLAPRMNKIDDYSILKYARYKTKLLFDLGKIDRNYIRSNAVKEKDMAFIIELINLRWDFWNEIDFMVEYMQGDLTKKLAFEKDTFFQDASHRIIIWADNEKLSPRILRFDRYTYTNMHDEAMQHLADKTKITFIARSNEGDTTFAPTSIDEEAVLKKESSEEAQV